MNPAAVRSAGSPRKDGLVQEKRSVCLTDRNRRAGTAEGMRKPEDSLRVLGTREE